MKTRFMELIRDNLTLNKSKEELPIPNQLSTIGFINKLYPPTLLGLWCFTLRTWFAFNAQTYLSILCGAYSVSIYYKSGLIVSKSQNRIDQHKTLGPQLDSSIDIISFGILTTIFLLSYNQLNQWYVTKQFITTSYPISFGNSHTCTPINYKTYTESPIDINELYVLIIVISFLNPSSRRIPKFNKSNHYYINLCPVYNI